MADDDSELLEAELTADEILTFGPCIEAQVWTPVFLQEQRAPIAVAAGRPKFGKVFDDKGVGNAVIIRPCMSRGRRIRGLPPVYTPQMLERHASTFDGWPMFMDHAPAELAATLAKHGRSVKELGGQVLKGRWSRDFVQESDAEFGYRKGGVLAEVWATPLVRRMVGENPNLLHTSINAWPTSGKPGPCPWRPNVKGMVIEGIRRQPQGSVDYVVRGGAGGKLLVAEGLEEEGAWPEVGEWSEDDRRLVVSLAESLYASPRMSDLVLPSDPGQLGAWLQENAPHLAPAIGLQLNESDAEERQVAQLMKQGKSLKEAWQIVRRKSGNGDSDGDGAARESVLTEADVRRLVSESMAGAPSVEEFEQHLREQTDAIIATREEQRRLADRAGQLIEAAEGVPPKWKADLKARYTMRPEGAPATLLVESEQDGDGNTLTPDQVLEARVGADIDHVRELIAEATGRPRVSGEGGAKRDESASSGATKASRAHWRTSFVRMGLAESEDKAVEAFGGKVEG